MIIPDKSSSDGVARPTAHQSLEDEPNVPRDESTLSTEESSDDADTESNFDEEARDVTRRRREWEENQRRIKREKDGRQLEGPRPRRGPQKKTALQ